MKIDDSALLAIALMGIVTYGLRAGGYWLMGRVSLSPRIEAALAYLPGAVIASMVVPGVIQAGGPGIVAFVAVCLAMWRLGNVVVAMLAGVVVVWLVRQI